jgi:hypothetical protein
MESLQERSRLADTKYLFADAIHMAVGKGQALLQSSEESDVRSAVRLLKVMKDMGVRPACKSLHSALTLVNQCGPGTQAEIVDMFSDSFLNRVRICRAFSLQQYSWALPAARCCSTSFFWRW